MMVNVNVYVVDASGGLHPRARAEQQRAGGVGPEHDEEQPHRKQSHRRSTTGMIRILPPRPLDG